jgi:outer membrane receptor protein involved in Fe transport
MGKQWLVCVLCLLFTAGISSFAQTDRGVITGTVRDATGAVVPGAQVTATHTATNTGFKTNTTSSGDFTAPSLPVGAYQVKVESSGFRTHIRESVVLTAGSTARVDVQLEVGASQQTVEVTASAQMLMTDTARVSSQVSNTLVNQLPVVVSGGVRSPFDLASITPDVTGTGSDFRIAGGTANHFGMTLDGVSLSISRSASGRDWVEINAPSVESITEFAVESGGFKAEFGQASGGSVSFVSKSGTNAVHGSAYEFLRNQVLDARGFFGAAKQVYKQNNFGATVGGPVWIPKLYSGRDKTFFFFSYEGFRNRVGASPTPYSIPPPEFFTGDLRNFVDASGKMYQIYDPGTQRLVGSSYVRDPFANNQIPQNRFDPLVKAINAYVQPLLKPNVSGLVPGTSGYTRNNYVSYGTSISPQNKYNFKVDQVLTTNHRLSFLFGRTRDIDDYGPEGAPGLPKPLSGNPGYNRSDVYRLSWDYTLSPTWLNRFNAGINRWRQNHGSYATYKDAPQSDCIPTTNVGWKEKGICIPNYPDCNANFPQVGFANSEFTTWGVAAPNGSDNNVLEFKDDMTKSSGPHTLKWGYMYNRTDYNGFGLQNIAGNMTFNRLSTSIPLNTNQATGGGSAFAAFLLGNVSGYSLDTPRYINAQWRYHAMYFQDDWRVGRRLTLNLGLRYEFTLPQRVGQDQYSELDLAKPNPGAGGIPGALIFAGNGPGRENTRTLTPTWWGAIGPRLGFSYALDSKTVIRGSFARSFGPVKSPANSTHNLGFVVRLTNSDTSQGLSPLWIMKDGAPAWEMPPKIDPSVGNGQNAPYGNGKVGTLPSDEISVTFNIQRQLTGNMVVEAGYKGMGVGKILSSLLAYDQIDFRTLPATLDPFTASGRTLLNSMMGSAAANAAGIKPPFSAFNTLWGSGATVRQALRPFPQYSGIDTYNGSGDRLGHHTYHSLMLKFEKRYSAGLTFQASYVLSKAMGDVDGGAMDHYNRRLEKTIESIDQTHTAKLSYVYELPFGPARKYLNSGVASRIVGGWRASASHMYVSGTPMSLGTTISFPIFAAGGNRPAISTYDGWRGNISGEKFDPAVDSFLQPASFFGTQPTDRFGNMTRYNPKLRGLPILSEDISVSRSIRIKEGVGLDFRCEAFNLLNRTRFGSLSGGNSLQNANFGLWRSQSNSPRRLQLVLKLTW